MKRLSLILLTAVLTVFSFGSSAQGYSKHIENMQQFQAEKKGTAAPEPTKEGSQYWHRSKYQREQAPAMGTEAPSAGEHQDQKYDRPDWAPK